YTLPITTLFPYTTLFRSQTGLRNGNSFPKARTDAILSYLKQKSDSDRFQSFDLELNQLESILSSPNNILGIEYLKALQRLSSSRSEEHTSELQSRFDLVC